MSEFAFLIGSGALSSLEFAAHFNLKQKNQSPFITHIDFDLIYHSPMSTFLRQRLSHLPLNSQCLCTPNTMQCFTQLHSSIV